MARRLMDGVDLHHQDSGECLPRMFTKSLHRDSLPKITHCRHCWTILLDHTRRSDRLMALEQQQKLCTLPFSSLFVYLSLHLALHLALYLAFCLVLHLAHQSVLHLALHLAIHLTLRFALSGCTRHFRLDSRLLNSVTEASRQSPVIQWLDEHARQNCRPVWWKSLLTLTDWFGNWYSCLIHSSDTVSWYSLLIHRPTKPALG